MPSDAQASWDETAEAKGRPTIAEIEARIIADALATPAPSVARDRMVRVLMAEAAAAEQRATLTGEDYDKGRAVGLARAAHIARGVTP